MIVVPIVQPGGTTALLGHDQRPEHWNLASLASDRHDGIPTDYRPTDGDG
jgi:hypothetical protein